MIRPKQPSDLLGDGSEDLGLRGLARHERRHTPQRRLLLRQPCRLGARVGVRDGSGNQLGELREPILDVVGHGLTIRGTDADHAPHLAADDDRRPRTRTQPARAGSVRERAGDARQVDPRGASGPDLLGHCGDRRRFERPVGARLERTRPLTPGAHHGCRAITLEAPDVDDRHVQELSDLPGDGGEHLGRRRAVGDDRRDPPQRRLLLCVQAILDV